MLYLEDYLEMIENLPMEMRDRFTEMREMDLQVQNAMDSLDDKVKTFFGKCGGQTAVKQEWKDEQFEDIKNEYKKALEDADEKVQLANQIYEMVERHLRKLDQEVSKFKMELEADNAGITEVLEKRSLEMDIPPHHVNNHRAEKRKYTTSGLGNHVDKRRTATEKVLTSLANEAVRESLGPLRTESVSQSPSTTMFSSTPPTPAISYSLGHVGAGSNAAIAAAASRAIGATLTMQQGRRTASLKASYEVMSRSTDLANELQVVSNDISLPTTPTATPTETPKASRSKKSGTRGASQQAAAAATPQTATTTPAAVSQPSATGETTTAEDGAAATATWQYDPNEPRYCICNDVSYGDMVGCDNEDCPIEWFHYGCVGLAQAPKGKWFCPQCTAAMRRRGRK